MDIWRYKYIVSLIIGETRLAIPPRRSCSASCSDVLLQVSSIKRWNQITEVENTPEFENGITTKNSSDKDPIGFQQMPDLR